MSEWKITITRSYEHGWTMRWHWEIRENGMAPRVGDWQGWAYTRKGAEHKAERSIQKIRLKRLQRPAQYSYDPYAAKPDAEKA